MAEGYKPVRLVMIDNNTSYKKLYHVKNGFLSSWLQSKTNFGGLDSPVSEFDQKRFSWKLINE